MSKLIALDIETFPNFFQIGLKEVGTDNYISIDIRNEEVFNDDKYDEFVNLVEDNTIITYNGLKYDNLLLSFIIEDSRSTTECYEFSSFIINQVQYKDKGFKWNKRTVVHYRDYLKEHYSSFGNKTIEKLMSEYLKTKGRDISTYKFMRIFNLDNYPYESIDLMKVTPAPASLKMYGAMMNMNIQELPYDFNKSLDNNQINNIITYNENDLNITLELYDRLKGDIELRQKLNKLHEVNTKNPYNDFRNKGNANLGLALLGTKMKIPKSTVTSKYKYTLDLPDYLYFEDSKLQEILEKLKNYTFTLNDNMSINLPEFLNEPLKLANNVFTLGLGGLHSNEKSLSVTASIHRGETIRNIDVTSYYPNMIFVNGFAPTHLNTNTYVNTLISVFKDRVIAKRDNKRLKKISRDRKLTHIEQKEFNDAKLIDATNKIVLNGGGFGKMGDKYSDTFDPKAMTNVTITGQLSLLMLIEQLDKIDGITILSSNTDGIELLDSKNKLDDIKLAVTIWELKTNLNMEYGEYTALHARDVNNYVAVYKGYTKAKGVYAEPILGKSITHKIVYKAINQFLLDGTCIKYTIINCTDIKEFVSIAKVTGGAICNYTYIEKNDSEVLVKDGEIQYKVIPKSKRDKINGIDILEIAKKDDKFMKENYFKIYDKNNPKTKVKVINGSEITHDGDNIGSTIRYYYTNKNSTNINRAKSGSKVPNGDGVTVLQNINNYNPDKYPIDYDRYIEIAKKELLNLGWSGNVTNCIPF